LPESFKYLSKLTFINLSKNKLTSFPDSIRGFTELKELYLSKNKLKTIPEWIGEFNASMITLDLSKTESSNFPEGIYELKKL
jgi:Leucine-rich repeat (LRR) protein